MRKPNTAAGILPKYRLRKYVQKTPTTMSKQPAYFRPRPGSWLTPSQER